MNAGPPGPPPEEVPPPAEEAAAPEPSWVPPPSGGPSAAPPRSRGPLVAIIAIVVLLIIVVVGYGVGGYAYSQGRLNSAQSSYNAVVDHQNSLNDAVKSLNSQVTSSDLGTASAASIDQEKAAMTAVVTKSQAAQTQIATDDATLAKAATSLDENSWLTVLRKPDIDKAKARIAHLRKALADAKTITADYVQDGALYQAMFAVVSDLDSVGAKVQAHDLSGATTANNLMKTDTDKAIALDKAPGVPADVDTLLQAIKSLAVHFGNLFTAAAAGDSTGINTAETALQADVTKIQAIDYAKIGAQIDAFYKPLLDDYNSEVDKANST